MAFFQKELVGLQESNAIFMWSRQGENDWSIPPTCKSWLPKTRERGTVLTSEGLDSSVRSFMYAPPHSCPFWNFTSYLECFSNLLADQFIGLALLLSIMLTRLLCKLSMTLTELWRVCPWTRMVSSNWQRWHDVSLLTKTNANDWLGIGKGAKDRKWKRPLQLLFRRVPWEPNRDLPQVDCQWVLLCSRHLAIKTKSSLWSQCACTNSGVCVVGDKKTFSHHDVPIENCNWRNHNYYPLGKSVLLQCSDVTHSRVIVFPNVMTLPYKGSKTWVTKMMVLFSEETTPRVSGLEGRANYCAIFSSEAML